MQDKARIEGFVLPKGGVGLRLTIGGAVYEAPAPIVLEIKKGPFPVQGEKPEEYRLAYDSFQAGAEGYIGLCRATTRDGSVLAVRDIILSMPCHEVAGAFRLFRQVEVEHSSGQEEGFATRFELLEKDGPRDPAAYDIFVPGIWYGQNRQVVGTAYAANLTEDFFLFRATRMALPYVQQYNPTTKAWVSLCHEGPQPSTALAETSAEWLVGEGFQYPSLGVVKNGGRLALAYQYPGSEGERNYIEPAKQWARRSHPLYKGVRHQYQMLIRAGFAPDCRVALKDGWRSVYARFAPPLHPADLAAVYESGVEVLDAYCQEYNGATGLPFWATVPQGMVCDISFQMGFVGQQPQCALHLMRHGLATENQTMVEKGCRVIEFWVREAAKDSVLPKVWYDVFPPAFRKDYPTYTRTLADGLEGILAAWNLMRRQGQERPAWLAFCLRYGDWLCSNQNEDGSWYRAYTWQGEPTHTGKYNTSNPVRFLVNLYWATGEQAYLQAAQKAGEYCYEQFYFPLQYIGGTADNDNTVDKEAGMLALYAFVSLYEADASEKWLQAACGAADFCATWTYAWAYPVLPKKGNCVFGTADITGLSLISTGHSHADVMMAYCPFDFYRLYELTDDTFYKDFALFLLHNTKQTMDWSGTRGYAYRGILEESGEVALQYHNGLGRWLPWCTIAQIEPLMRFEEWYGEMDIRRLEEDKGLGKGRIRGSSWLRV